MRLMHAAVEDAGRYTCVVSNPAGEERMNFDLDVIGKRDFLSLGCSILLEKPNKKDKIYFLERK